MPSFELRGGFKDTARHYKIEGSKNDFVVCEGLEDKIIFSNLFLSGGLPSCTIDLAGSSDGNNQAAQFASPEAAQKALEILNSEKKKKKIKK